MGKDLVPRFKCPLCGWLAYYSMFERGPHKLEIKGMKYGGFQEISYHKIWTGKREYKEYLRGKVRELAKVLGIKLADEEFDEEIADEYEEVEAQPSEVEEEIWVEKPSRQVMEIPAEFVDRGPQQRTAKKATYKELLASYHVAKTVEHVEAAGIEDVRTIEHEFIGGR